MKILDGRELAGFVKERQARAEKNGAKLLILRDSDNPVIVKYVELKKRYGADIGVAVEDYLAPSVEALKAKIAEANADPGVGGMIVQLPLCDAAVTDEVVSLIAPEKDVDGLSGRGRFDSATATAINWLLAGYDIHLQTRRIALVGKGRLVGGPLYEMWTRSGLDVTVFRHGADLTQLVDYDVVVTATGVPHLIKPEMLKAGAVVVDAGTASEDGVLVGDVDEAVRVRGDLLALTPRVGGVGPLTVAVLFENVIAAGADHFVDVDKMV